MYIAPTDMTFISTIILVLTFMSVDTMYQLELKLWLRKILGIYSGNQAFDCG